MLLTARAVAQRERPLDARAVDVGPVARARVLDAHDRLDVPALAGRDRLGQRRDPALGVFGALGAFISRVKPSIRSSA